MGHAAVCCAQLAGTSAVWFPNAAEQAVSQRLAAMAAAGLQLVHAQPALGALTWQLVRGAAVKPAAAAAQVRRKSRQLPGIVLRTE